MATPLIRVMNGHIYRVPNRRKCSGTVNLAT